MFDFSKWLVSGIIDGFKNGQTPFSKVTELTANYFTKGLISQDQAEQIATECPAPATEKETIITEETETEAEEV
jgi:hypothetical protein